MQLKVIKKFNGKAEGKVLQPGDVIVSKDVKRINTLVSGGYCEILSLSDKKEKAADAADTTNGDEGGEKTEE